jgi:uncharacterized protein (TIGR00369 family)
MTGLQLLEALRDGEIPPPGVVRTLGGGIESVEEGRVVFWLEPDDRHTNPMGATHGGVLATLLDSAMGCAVQSALPEGRGYTTVELSVNFVRAVMPGSGRILAEGRVLHAGGRVATAEGRMTTADGKLVAHAKTTCLVLEGGG